MFGEIAQAAKVAPRDFETIAGGFSVETRRVGFRMPIGGYIHFIITS